MIPFSRLIAILFYKERIVVMKQIHRRRRATRRKGASRRRNRQRGGGPNPGDTYLSRDEFNKKFNSDIVTLPIYMNAIGFLGGVFYIYDEENKFKRGTQKEDTFPFLKEIFKLLNKDPVYLIINYSDGYSERMPTPIQPVEYYMAAVDQFKGKDEISENNPHRYPLLHSKKYVLCFSKRVFDPYSIAIPNPYHFNGTIDSRLKEIHENIVPWAQKQPRAVWRGTLENGEEPNIRRRLVALVKDGKLPLVDYSDTKMSIVEMAKFKYQLDLDGWTNAWDGLVWKLASGSVVLKNESKWEQIYYKWMKPWVHYIPVKEDLSDLAEKLQWCVEHDGESERIGLAGQKFVREMLTIDVLTKETVANIQKAV